MKYSIHENGWTVIVDEIDLHNPKQEDINRIARFLATNTLVVIPGQQITIEEELRIINMFKEPEIVEPSTEHKTLGRCIVPESENKIIRVTGALNDDGHPGFFGHSDELKWHCNNPSSPDAKKLIWLRSVAGSEGSVTEWNNNVLSYNELDEETKLFLDNAKGVFGYDPKRFAETEYRPDPFMDYVNTPNIVQTNRAGIKGMLMPFLQLFHFVGLTEEESKPIINRLAEHTTQKKYVYTHHWKDGDIVIGDQIFGVHRRLYFENMKERLLHRIAFDYPDIEYPKN